ncbi:AsmA family protein [Bradyrhizobium sp. HKCCYLS1011]|uniref:AsmA family protein n=1 Tax=Bradyrhizobium sp. HKCCYLS1011 TaxID=3420733 RepID=UPI003EBADAC6
MKALKIASAAIGLFVVILAALLAFGVPASVLMPAIRDRVERETGYRLSSAGAGRITLWPRFKASLTEITLQDPKDRDGNNRLTIGKVEAEAAWSSLWSDRPELSGLTIENPTLYLPLLRERLRDAPSRNAGPASSATANPILIDKVTVSDGAVVLSNVRDRVEQRIDAIQATAAISADNKMTIIGRARAGEHPLTFDVAADAHPTPIDRQAVPVDFKIEVPGVLRSPLSGRAEVRLNGKLVTISNVGGTLDDGAFNGWTSIDIASKPLVKLDLDLQRLAIADSNRTAVVPQQGWSTASIDFRGLNYIDVQAKLSVTELDVAGARLGPAAVDASLAGGVLKATVDKLSLYDGQANGELIVDASGDHPAYAMHWDIVGARALPLLQNLVDFDKIDARMQAKLALRSSGASQQAILSNVAGSAFLVFQDGAIRGINVAQMIRSLTSNPLAGWQDSKELSTDLSQLSASFNVERGQATTGDLNLIGPLVKVTGAGTIDIGNKSLALRVEPKLVMTTEGQGRRSDPVGLGIPVVIDGSWSQPRIYPDVTGILDNPDAAYAKLKQMGQGLFGRDGAGLGDLINGIGGLIGHATSSAPDGQGNSPSAPDSPRPSDALGGELGATLGNLIQQGLQQGLNSRGRAIAPPQPANPSVQPPAAQVPQGQDAMPDVSHDDAQDSQPMNDVLRRLFNR